MTETGLDGVLFSPARLSPERQPVAPTVLRKTNFEEGTFGHAVFPPELEGRKRWIDLGRSFGEYNRYQIYHSPYGETRYEIWPLFPKKGDHLRLFNALSSNGVSSIADILHLPETKLDEYGLSEKDKRMLKAQLRSRVGLFLKQLAVGGEGYLLAASTTQEPVAIPVEFEEGRRQAIMQALASLPNERNQNILSLRFGLPDGIPRNQTELSIIFGVTTQYIDALETRMLRKLRHPERIDRFLSPYLFLNDNCLARRVLRFVINGQITKVIPDEMAERKHLEDLPLSSKTKEALVQQLVAGRLIFTERTTLDRLLREQIDFNKIGDDVFMN